MGQAIFFSLQSHALLGILQLGRLQSGQHLVLFRPLGLELIPLAAGKLKSLGRLFPGAAGQHHRLQQRLQCFPAATIQPAALLAWTRQLLGLALDGEIQ